MSDHDTEGKDPHDAIEPPTPEQIDLIFAYLLDSADEVASGPMSEPVLEMVANLWDSTRELAETDAFRQSDPEVARLKEEWL